LQYQNQNILLKAKVTLQLNGFVKRFFRRKVIRKGWLEKRFSAQSPRTQGFPALAAWTKRAGK
jgi:predicted DNA-binding transcriptional regulator